MLVSPSLEWKGFRLDITVNKELYIFRVKTTYMSYNCKIKVDGHFSDEYLNASISTDLKYIIFNLPITINNKLISKILIPKSKKHLFIDYLIKNEKYKNK